MNTKYLVNVTAIILIVVFVTILIIGFSFRPTPFSTPVPLLFGEVSSLGEEDMNVSQGSTLQVNVTLTSNTDQELTIPIENLALSGFNNTSWGTSIPQNKVFNYTFSASKLVLQPYESNSTVLAVDIADDAPLGQYALSIELGDWQVTYVGDIGLTITVVPNLLS